MSLKVISILLWLTFFGFQGTALANVERVRLQLEGLACPFCNTHVVRELEEVQGVKQFEMDLDPNQALFTWDSRVPFRPWVFYEIVKSDGYDLQRIDIIASGHIVTNGNCFYLYCPCSHTYYLLRFCNSQIQDCFTRISPLATICISGTAAWCSRRPPTILTVKSVRGYR